MEFNLLQLLKMSGIFGLGSIALGLMLGVITAVLFFRAKKRAAFVPILVGALLIFCLGLAGTAWARLGVEGTHDLIRESGKEPTPEEIEWGEMTAQASTKVASVPAIALLVAGLLGMATRKKESEDAQESPE